MGRAGGWTTWRSASTGASGPTDLPRGRRDLAARRGWRCGWATTISSSTARRRSPTDGSGAPSASSRSSSPAPSTAGWRRSAPHLVLGRRPGCGPALGGRARRVGAGLGVVDLEMFGLATEGLALVNQGEVGDGMRRLDEAAAAALGGEYEQLAPAGWTCCYLIYACERVRDYDRAAQWCRKVEEFSRRMRIRFVNGTCRAHYAAVLRVARRWSGAERELLQALTDLTAVRPFWRSEAVVRLAELRRRQGRLAEAADLFAQAEHHDVTEIGIGALRLDEGDAGAARDHVERVLRRLPAASATKRTGLLELMARALAALGDPRAARPYLDELEATAARREPRRCAPARAWRPVSWRARRASTRPPGGASRTRSSCSPRVARRSRPRTPGSSWRASSPRWAARTRPRARRRQRCAAATSSAPQAQRAGAGSAGRLGRTPNGRADGPLTARQLEVLRLVADGLSDRQIADRLGLSEHTVHRHMQNSYARLRCRSRAAAVAGRPACACCGRPDGLSGPCHAPGRGWRDRAKTARAPVLDTRRS